MKFLADMGVAQRITEWLRSEGHEITHLREEGLERLPDNEIFEKAIKEERIILTFDLDFGEIAAFATERKVSIIVFRLNNTSTPHVRERLKAVLADCSEQLRSGAVIVVEESRHRVRSLPIRQLP